MFLRRALFLSIAIFLARAGFAAEQEFRFEKPDAQSVSLMCECKNWQRQPMTKGTDGVWTTSASLSPGSYGYKFLVNGSDWVLDPKNSNRKNVNGVENSAIDVADDSAITARSTSPSSGAGVVATNGSSLSPSPNEVFTVEIPLSTKRRAEAAKDGNAKLAHAKLALVVPSGFDPQKSWPILVICNTEAYSNIDSLQQFKDAASAEGWVTMAADGVETEPKKEGGDRWPTIAAAFDYLTNAWPGIKDWPVACGGMSGGGKNGAFLAADLAREHHRIIGMLMMGCNQDMATVAYRKSAPPNFLSAAVFLSSGKNDKIATPESHVYVMNSLKATGFKVRLESHDGAHDIYPPHIGEALRWFIAQSSAGAPAKRETDFDKFFKKKTSP